MKSESGRRHFLSCALLGGAALLASRSPTGQADTNAAAAAPESDQSALRFVRRYSPAAQVLTSAGSDPAGRIVRIHAPVTNLASMHDTLSRSRTLGASVVDVRGNDASFTIDGRRIEVVHELVA